MEYQDYVNYHKMFGLCDGEQFLSNPHNTKHQWCTRYNATTGIVRGTWFELTKDSFKLTDNYNSPWNIGMEYSYTEIDLNVVVPKIINIVYQTAQEFTVNGHKAHKNLEISLKTGKATFYKNAAYPNTDEEKTAAVSTLRKHVTAYKKKARPIFRLLEGSLTQNDEKRNNSSHNWATRHKNSDDLGTHELYEILRNRNPTPPEIAALMNKGNSSLNYSSVTLTSFEASMSRVIQRRRKDLQSFALMEANNEYKTPTEIQNGVDNGTTQN